MASHIWSPNRLTRIVAMLNGERLVLNYKRVKLIANYFTEP